MDGRTAGRQDGRVTERSLTPAFHVLEPFLRRVMGLKAEIRPEEVLFALQRADIERASLKYRIAAQPSHRIGDLLTARPGSTARGAPTLGYGPRTPSPS